MATKKEISAAAKGSDKWLKAKQKQHISMIQNSTKKLQKNILDSLNVLKMSPTGKLDGIKTNLGTAQKLQKRIEELFYSDFNNHTKKIVRDFKTAQAAIAANFTMIGEAAEFTNVDKTMMGVLRDGYYADYLAIGETAKNKVVQSVYDNVIGNGQFSDLVNEINGALVGTAAVGVTGSSLAQYARLYARDMIMNYHNEVTLKKADDLGMDTFIYTGTIMGATRRFCRRRIGNPYTTKEINSWKYKWKGKSGPALTHRGGYNCRHHWQPVRKKWLDDKELSMLDKTWKLDKNGMPMIGLSSTAKRRAAKKAADIRAKLKAGETFKKATAAKEAAKAAALKKETAAVKAAELKKKEEAIAVKAVAAERARVAKEAAKTAALKKATAAKAKKAREAAAEKLRLKKLAEEAEDRAVERQLQALNDAAKKERLAKEALLVKKAPAVKISARQKKAINVSDVNSLTDKSITNLQKWTLEKRRLKLSKADIKKLSKSFEELVPFHMNRALRKGSASYKDLMANGEFKNQFQLGKNATSGGSHGPYKGSSRDGWEKNITQGILQTNPKYKKLGSNDYMNVGGIADERPMYGYVSDPGQMSGARIGGSYGDITFVLNDNARKRSTLFTTNTSRFVPRAHTMSSPKNNRIMLRAMIDNTIQVSNADLKKIIAGKKKPFGFTNTSYTESQIYGGVNLKRDVKEVLVNRNTPHIKDLADKWGIKYIVGSD